MIKASSLRFWSPAGGLRPRVLCSDIPSGARRAKEASSAMSMWLRQGSESVSDILE